jgi:streptogramin lyase
MTSPTGARTFALSLAAFLLLCLLPAGAWAFPAVNGEFKVEGLTTNNKLVRGPDGNMWATVENGAKNVAKITPSGAVTEYELGVAGALGITVGAEGRLWITRANGLTSFTTADPPGSKENLDDADVGASHSIVLGPDGNFWVATNDKVLVVPGGKPAAAINPATEVKTIPVAELSPRDIDAAGQLLVVADAGVKSRIVTLTTAGVEKDYPLPPGGASQGVAGNGAGLIAYSQPGIAPEGVGLISPPNALPQINTPGGGDPFGVAFGSDQAFWVVRSASSDLARVTTSGAISFLSGLKNEPRQIAAGPNNTLWVSQTKTGEEAVARVTGLEPPSPPPPPPPTHPPVRPPHILVPETTLGKGPKGTVFTAAKRAAVKFRFFSPTTVAGVSFQCRLIRLPGKKANASMVSPFRACRSPQAYRLVSGRYRFEARAVLGGFPDPTPAARTFRIVRAHEIAIGLKR